MVACCCGEPKAPDPITDIKRDRPCCTDIVMLIAFILSWAVLAVILVTAINKGGDYQKILHPLDMQGRICGVDKGVQDLPLGALPYPWSTEAYKSWVCVKDCKDTQDVDNKRMSALYPSVQLAYFCLPTPFLNLSISLNIEGTFDPNIMSAVEAGSRAMGDIWATRYVIGASMGVAIVVSFVFLYFLRCCAKAFVYSLLALILVFGIMFAQVLLNHAATSKTNASYDPAIISMLEGAGYAIMAATAIFVIIIFFLRNNIDIAIEVCKEASRALGDMKTIVFFPIIPTVIALAYALLWCLVASTLYSTTTQKAFDVSPAITKYHQPTWVYYASNSGRNLMDFKTQMTGGTNPLLPTNGTEFTFTTDSQFQFVLAIFHFFWVTQFCFYYGYLTFAGAAADWYFTASDASGKKKRGDGPDELTNWPVMASALRTLRHHLGTIAVCAFIIAVVKTIRAIVLYLEQRTKGDPPNKLQTALFCILKCYLRCVECCLDKINKYSLVWTAVYGDGFCKSVCSSFALVWRNLDKIAAVNMVGTVIFMMGKISIGLMSAGIIGCILVTVPPFSTELMSPLAPCFMVFAVGYFVATAFFIVFSSTIDTMFMCFLIDCEINGPTNSMVASKELQKLVGKYQKHSSAEAKRVAKDRADRGGTDTIQPFNKYVKMEQHEEVELVENH